MAVKSDPEKGINSWLEDELYQQYLHDHGAVDESWKHVFEERQGQRAVRRRRSRRKPGPQQAVTATAPRRRAGRRCAERPRASRKNMKPASTIPLATSQRTIPVKVIDENRRIINQHRALLGKSKVSYTHIIGWAIVRALRIFSRPEPCVRRTERRAVPRGARRTSTWASRWTWRARTARAICWSRTSRMPARWIFRSTSRPSTTW